MQRQKIAKGSPKVGNSHRRDAKKARYVRSLRNRINPKSKKFRSEKDAKKAARLYAGNKNK